MSQVPNIRRMLTLRSLSFDQFAANRAAGDVRDSSGPLTRRRLFEELR